MAQSQQKRREITWSNPQRCRRPYSCPHCGRVITSVEGYEGGEQGLGKHWLVICPHCSLPTHFGPDGKQTPGAPFGKAVQHLEAKVEAVYKEARHCMSVGAHTATVMLCRKILMNVAVHEGAEANKTFAYYVDYLANEGHVPKRLNACIAHIRHTGNEANHEIEPTGREAAERVMNFTEIMLTVMYEMPGRLPKPESEAEDDA